MRVDPEADRSMLKMLRRETGQRGPWLRLLSEVLALGGPSAQFLTHSERPWSSAMFSGSRHTIAMSFTGNEAIAGGEHLIAALPDHEFTITGQLVAGATITSVEYENGPEPHMTVEAELLLLEDV